MFCSSGLAVAPCNYDRPNRSWPGVIRCNTWNLEYGVYIESGICSVRVCSRGVNYSEKSVRRFLGLENPGNFSWDSGNFFPKFKGFWDFFQLIFSKYFPLFFSPNFFRNFLRHIIRRIIFKTR